MFCFSVERIFIFIIYWHFIILVFLEVYHSVQFYHSVFLEFYHSVQFLFISSVQFYYEFYLFRLFCINIISTCVYIYICLNYSISFTHIYLCRIIGKVYCNIVYAKYSVLDSCRSPHKRDACHASHIPVSLGTYVWRSAHTDNTDAFLYYYRNPC